MRRSRSVPQLCIALSLTGAATRTAAAGPVPIPSVMAAGHPAAGTSSPDDAPVVVMIVSPRMVHALTEWQRMRRSAEAAGFVVLSLRDPRVADDEWQAALRAAGLTEAAFAPRLHDAAIERIGVQNHFPSSVVGWAGRLHPWPILGVMPDAAFVALLRLRLHQLREAG